MISSSTETLHSLCFHLMDCSWVLLDIYQSVNLELWSWDLACHWDHQLLAGPAETLTLRKNISKGISSVSSPCCRKLAQGCRKRLCLALRWKSYPSWWKAPDVREIRKRQLLRKQPKMVHGYVPNFLHINSY